MPRPHLLGPGNSFAAMRLVDLLVAALLLAGLSVLATALLREETAAGHAYAIDGDTLELAGTRMRLAGIDAPELHQTCMRDGQSWDCGIAARRALAAALRSGPVTCTHRRSDKYGRPLARCMVDGQDIAALLVAQGLALSYLDTRYQPQEAVARAERRGLWASRFERPVEYRAAHPR